MPRKKSLSRVIIVAMACISYTATGWGAGLQEGPVGQRAIAVIQSSIENRPEQGWWIVVGSFSAANTPAMAGEFRAVNDALARCGLHTFNDLSNKFAGFRPGFNVFVVGPYRTRGEARRILQVAKTCAPGASLKYGEYAGE